MEHLGAFQSDPPHHCKDNVGGGKNQLYLILRFCVCVVIKVDHDLFTGLQRPRSRNLKAMKVWGVEKYHESLGNVM